MQMCCQSVPSFSPISPTMLNIGHSNILMAKVQNGIKLIIALHSFTHFPFFVAGFPLWIIIFIILLAIAAYHLKTKGLLSI